MYSIKIGEKIMINGIKPNISNTTKTEKTVTKNGLSFDEAMDNLLVKIQEAYSGWGGSRIDKKLDLSLKVGRKFIKVVEGTRVWGFVAKVDGTHKGLPMLKGDILKAATWRAPAKHSRGSIFDSEMHKSFSWTGPNYL
tara:strand:- start:370 stop:783 length:414 start_codon:yes stop_codon:yes gene_type:complete